MYFKNPELLGRQLILCFSSGENSKRSKHFVLVIHLSGMQNQINVIKDKRRKFKEALDSQIKPVIIRLVIIIVAISQLIGIH